MHQMMKVLIDKRQSSFVAVAALAVTMLSAARALALPPEVEAMLGTNGVWPARQMTELMVDDWTAQATETYGLTNEQRAAFEKTMRDRWLGFVEENQAELGKLLNDYLEARFADAPPNSDDVADWATRAAPLFEQARGNLERGQAEMREILDSRQREWFDAQQERNATALEQMAGKLKRWSVGRFDDREWWTPPGERAAAANRTASLGAGLRSEGPADAFAPIEAGALPKRVAEEMDAWTRYVRDFCDHFELDQAQRNAAESMLREMTARARDFVYKRRGQVADVERMIAHTVDAMPDKVDREIEAVYGPIDEMFSELDERLHRLPTPAQARRAEILQQQRATGMGEGPATQPTP